MEKEVCFYLFDAKNHFLTNLEYPNKHLTFTTNFKSSRERKTEFIFFKYCSKICIDIASRKYIPNKEKENIFGSQQALYLSADTESSFLSASTLCG